MRVCAFFTALLGLSLLAACSSKQDGDLGAAIASYMAGNASPAIPVLQKHAGQGDRNALYFLGRAYFEGKGVPVNLPRAADAFVKATERGDINAPVWAGQVYEALGDPTRSATFHRTALQRALHSTSMLALGRMHRRSLVSGSSQIASARYFASAQVMMDAQPGLAKQDYLAPFSCFELTQAAFVEERSSNPASSLGFSDLTDDFLACTNLDNRTALTQRLVAAAALRLKNRNDGTLDESAVIFNFLDTKQDPRRHILPAPFKGYVAFASDADSDRLDASASGERFLNDHLGLPIASSIFPMVLGNPDPTTRVAEGNPFTGFYATVDQLDRSQLDGIPKYFSLARDWGHGRYDHLHSWYSDSQTLLVRLAAPLKNKINVPLVKAFDQLAPRYQAAGQVIRLYFSVKPAEDLRLAFTTRSGKTIAVNSAAVVNEQRTELDEGKSRYVVVLRLPAAFPLFAIDPNETIAFEALASLQMESPGCKEACDVVLEKIEVGVFDRQTAILQAQLFRDLNINPYGYTSHGGEGWHVHGDPSLLDAYWTKLKSETATPGTTYAAPTFPLANIKQSKGYVEDLLSEIGVRAVRPERLPSDRSAMDSIHDWDAPPKMFELYRGKMNFATTYFAGEPLAKAPIAEKRAFYNSRLSNQAAMIDEVCTAENCDPAQNAMLPVLIQASLQKAGTANEPFSHIWYTHFGAPTPAITPSVAAPFSKPSKAAFERLAEAHYGLRATGETSGEPRVRTAAPATAMRARKMQFIVDGGLMKIDRSPNSIRLLTTIDPFLGGAFPAAGHAGRDLGNLSFTVDDVFEPQVSIGDQKLEVARRRIPSGQQKDAGVVSIVDAESATTVVFGTAETSLKTQLALAGSPAEPDLRRTCAKPAQPTALFNAAYLAFANPFYQNQAEGDLDIELVIRPHVQDAFGIGQMPLKNHVFTSRPETRVAGGKTGTTVHTIDLPRSGSRQPETVIIDLATPLRYLPGERPSLSDLNLDGTIEDVCVSVLQKDAPPSVAFGPLRILTATLGDRPDLPSSIVVGGRISGSAGSAQEPTALSFAKAGSDEPVAITLDQGFYHGKLPGPGIYEMSMLRSSCANPPRVNVFIERDRLDLDLSMADCAPKLQTPAP